MVRMKEKSLWVYLEKSYQRLWKISELYVPVKSRAKALQVHHSIELFQIS